MRSIMKYISLLIFMVWTGITCPCFAVETNVASAVVNYIPEVNMDFWVVPILPGGGTDSASIRVSTSSSNLIMDFTVPAAYKLKSAKVRAPNCDYTTNNEIYYVDVMKSVAGSMTLVSLFSAPITVTDTGRNAVAAISDATIPDEALLSIFAYGSGTTPIINDMTLTLYLERQ